MYINQISFTLYPAHISIGKGNLVLRHSVRHASVEGLAIVSR